MSDVTTHKMEDEFGRASLKMEETPKRRGPFSFVDTKGSLSIPPSPCSIDQTNLFMQIPPFSATVGRSTST